MRIYSFFGTRCPYQAVVPLDGEEVVQASLPDCIYRINYNIRNARVKLWRVSVTTASSQVFAVEGKLAEKLFGKGYIEVYGFYFPIVVEIPSGEKSILSSRLYSILQRKPILYLHVIIVYNGTILRQREVVVEREN